MEKTITLTKEEAGLTDSYCYPKLYSIKHKINLQKNKNTL